VKGHLVDRGTAGTHRWWAVIDDHDPETGRRKRRWINLKTGLKREAQDALAKLLAQKQEGTLPPSAVARVTVADVLRAYVESRRVAGRAPRTIGPYSQLIEARIVPAIGQIRVHALRPADIEAFYAAQLEGPRHDRKAGRVSPSTVAKIHAILRAAFKHAVKQGTLVKNPVDAVTAPQPSRPEQKVLWPAQAAALLRAVRGHRLYGVVFLTLSACMREGELLGLRWSDVDLDGGRLYVRVQRQYIARTGIVERETKEHRGVRPIELTAGEAEVLRRQRATRAENRLRLGPIWPESGLVFPSDLRSRHADEQPQPPAAVQAPPSARRPARRPLPRPAAYGRHAHPAGRWPGPHRPAAPGARRSRDRHAHVRARAPRRPARRRRTGAAERPRRRQKHFGTPWVSDGWQKRRLAPESVRGQACKSLWFLHFGGAGGRIRTVDLRITSASLCRLSYTSMCLRDGAGEGNRTPV
jgi:integrase